ncbi:uncharacterized protein LOC141685814 [Apium graveolens]|uniref:uncharacterized protein LOC141685814 n=1 Tax=Apium graveolens TaxID=4045 RepID=UPI003D791C41
MANKQKAKKVIFEENDRKNNSEKVDDEIVPDVKTSDTCNEKLVQVPPQYQTQSSCEETMTTSESAKKRLGGARGVSALHKVVVKKARGKKFKVRYNDFGVPIGNTRPTLQSYIGMLARTMIPIDTENWPKVDCDLKAKLWDDVQDTFKIAPESEKLVLQSAGEKWRQFKADLTAKYVMPFIGKKKKLMKPPKKYAFVGKEPWKKFVAERTSPKWLEQRKLQSNRVGKRKYHHRLSRKGYIGLREEEIKKGNLKRKEKPDRAIFWWKARMPKNPDELTEEQAEINARIAELLEMKEKGKFVPHGTEDVLTTALQTPEHAGRVRGVGGFVTPTAFFNLPKAKKTKITKAELLDQLERNQREMAELKALVNASNGHSPMFSDKSSYQVPVNKEGAADKRNVGVAVKPLSAKQLLVNDEDFVGFDPSPPSGKKGPQSCELALDCIENKVAFGTVFDDHEEMNVSVHGVPLKPGHVRVSVDGHIQPEASVPVPIPGEIEVVRQAVGSHVAWPRELIIYPTVAKKKKEVLQGQSKRKDELQKLQDDYRKMKLNKNVPKQYKVLYKHAAVFMKATGESIPIPCDSDVFGTEKIIYILHENVKALLEFDMIGQAAISAYMA